MTRLSSFLSELKRRRVFRVAAVYAGVAFIIFQIIDATFDYLPIPDWVGTTIIVVLAIGFPITVGLAWAFDITDKGVVKTPPKGAATDATARPPIVIGNKILVAVAVAAIAVAVWSFWGRKTDPLAAFERSVVVMPFENLTGDENLDVWEKGVASLIFGDLMDAEGIYVLDSQTLFQIIDAIQETRQAQVIPDLAREVADRTSIHTLLLGDIIKTGTQLILQARLTDTRTGQVTFAPRVEGQSEEDLPAMAASLAEQLRNHLEISVMEQALPSTTRPPVVHSALAYRLYLLGLEDFTLLRHQPAIESLREAVALDSLIGYAYTFLIAAYSATGMHDSAKAVLDRVYPRKDQFTWDEQMRMEFWRAKYTQNFREVIHILEQYVARNPLQRGFWFNLGNSYARHHDYEKAIEAFERSFEVSERWGGWKWAWLYERLGEVYHKTNRHRKEMRVYQRGLELLPEHPLILRNITSCYLSRREGAQAAPYLERYKQAGEYEGWSRAEIAKNMGDLYQSSGLLDSAQSYYRQAMELNPEYVEANGALGMMLIENDLDIEEGLRLLEVALEGDQVNESYLQWKGWGLYTQGRNEEALVLLERAWDLSNQYNHDLDEQLDEVRLAVIRQNQ